MDLLSHVLMGLIAAAQVEGELRPARAVAVGIASLAPDLCFFPLGLKLGRDRGRWLWIPRRRDWDGCRRRHPTWVALSWDLPYSLFFLALLSLLLVARPDWLVFYLAYVLHILVDYATHAGEWNNRPLFPLSDRPCPTLVDSWEWPLRYNVIAWSVLTALLWWSVRG
jgi:membrane-bound metal-dependent hydrolase YbcI (DUF457 family)